MSDEEKKISKNRQKKEQIVAEIAERAEKAKGLVFTNYQGLTHKQLEEFKKAIKPLSGEFVVAKNTLVLRALERSGVKIENPANLEGPTGTMFLYSDPIEPLKKLAKMIKDHSLPLVKFGIIDNQALTSDQVLKLSALPSREILLAQVVGGLKSPIFGLHRALNWNLQKLVLTLNAVAKSKPAAPVATPESKAKVAQPLQTPQSVQAEVIVESAEPVAETGTEPQDLGQAKTENQQTENKTNKGGEN